MTLPSRPTQHRLSALADRLLYLHEVASASWDAIQVLQTLSERWPW